MEQRSVNTSASPEVSVEEVYGSLLVKGWEENEVRARSDSVGGLTVEEEHDSLTIRCQGDLTLRLPSGATLRIGVVHGDVRIKLLEDELSIEQVQGALTLRDLGPVNVGTIQGDLQARDLAGDLHIETVQGVAIIRDIQGEVSAGQIQGDLALRDVAGGIHASAGGSVKLRLGSLTGGDYRIEAGGDLYARIPEETSAQVHLSSGAQTLVLDLPGQHLTLEQGEHSLTLGGGQTQMDLSAGGILTLAGREVEWAGPEDFGPGFGEGFPGVSPDFTEQLTRQIEDQVEAQMARLSEQMARLSEMMGRSGLSEEEAERVMRQAQRSAEEATARAQEKIARAQERLARKVEAASRKAEQRARATERRRETGRGVSFTWPAPPRPPVPPRPPAAPWPPAPPTAPGGVNEPVSDEERLMILRMLEQKKITLEEAENLLAALEGKGK